MNIEMLIVILLQVRNWLFTMIGLQNPKEKAIESRRKYDFGDEVLAWRIKLRKERQVLNNTISRNLFEFYHTV